jgi:hypothetical protein
MVKSISAQVRTYELGRLAASRLQPDKECRTAIPYTQGLKTRWTRMNQLEDVRDEEV